MAKNGSAFVYNMFEYVKSHKTSNVVSLEKVNILDYSTVQMCGFSHDQAQISLGKKSIILCLSSSSVAL